MPEQPRIRRRNAPAAPALAGCHPLLARLYAARGIESPRQLDLSLGALHPPGSLKGIDAAARRLAQALRTGERILFVGDFDADGATSTALGVSVLRALGAAEVRYLVPNRFEFGYGLSPEIVDLARARGLAPDLLITVDNGISSIDGVAAARRAGIEVLITDHHLPGRQLPDAAVILNPNQAGCAFPSKALAGVGVLFYLLLALRAQLRREGWFERRGVPELNLASALDLVALGTVADVVALDHNNRILVEGGLQRIRAGRARPGVRALLEVAGREVERSAAADLAFAAGPRLNAAGRLDDMSLGIECLLAEDEREARRLALELDAMNRDRQRIERAMEAEALAALARVSLDARDLPAALVLYAADWHQGVVGILASRVKERFHRPVIAFADAGDGELKGSGRGIQGLHLRDLLDAVATRNPGLITRFGGHAMAAGLSLPASRLDAFRRAFVAAVAACGAGSTPTLETDGALLPEYFHPDIAEMLHRAGPWGQHFPAPLFDGEFEVLSQRLVGERHLKLRVAHPGVPTPLDAIAFRVDTQCWPDQSITRLRAAYRPEVNRYRGERRLQLLFEHFEAA